ncbi:MAG: DUF2520 domain-containing protein [Balneolaceae bacterium]|nr:DUF2520 domain-containing protein [Balneolaceae bacterium]
MNPDLSITIVGTGALGRTLAQALYRNGIAIASLYNRTPAPASELAEQLGAAATGIFPSAREELGDVLFLTVPDDAVEQTALELTGRIGDLTGITVAHCSGNLTSRALKAATDRGATAAAFHPIQTFTYESGPADFEGIYISLEGDDAAVELLTGIAGRLGATPLPVSQEAKPFLHAGAVMASNYLVSLLDAAGKISELGGVEPMVARRALMPLVRTALENASSGNLPEALSGPIARGDVHTVRSHLNLLEHNPGLLSLYKQLGLRALELARKKDSSGKKEAWETLNTMLNE